MSPTTRSARAGGAALREGTPISAGHDVTVAPRPDGSWVVQPSRGAVRRESSTAHGSAEGRRRALPSPRRRPGPRAGERMRLPRPGLRRVEGQPEGRAAAVHAPRRASTTPPRTSRRPSPRAAAGHRRRRTISSDPETTKTEIRRRVSSDPNRAASRRTTQATTRPVQTSTPSKPRTRSRRGRWVARPRRAPRRALPQTRWTRAVPLRPRGGPRRRRWDPSRRLPRAPPPPPRTTTRGDGAGGSIEPPPRRRDARRRCRSPTTPPFRRTSRARRDVVRRRRGGAARAQRPGPPRGALDANDADEDANYFQNGQGG